MRVVLGIDIGTSSSKGVLAELDGTIVATAHREHHVHRPAPGHVEMDPELWWTEFVELSRELLGNTTVTVVGVGVSGMGPCVALADVEGRATRPAILYGIDTRATRQISELTAALGEEAIIERCGSSLSTQSVGPKLMWLSENEPEASRLGRLLFMPSSWLAFRLTGEYVLDHHSASQCTPMYDTALRQWYSPWADIVAPHVELPRLVWPGEVVGGVIGPAAAATGIPEGTPVIAGTIDAWSEAISVGAQNVGDLMLMYGTTMFLVNTVKRRQTSSSMWGTVGALPGTYNLAGGMATSGAITTWIRELCGSDYPSLLEEAEASAAGTLLMLPYFAGERTPIADPRARGVIAGLTLETTRGELYRAALEATAFGVRHNIEALRAGGGVIDRVVAVGGGTQGGLWPQLVSDVTGVVQVVPSVTIGASFGGAFLAAQAIAGRPLSMDEWNPVSHVVQPRARYKSLYDARYADYRELYERTADIVHRLAA